MPDGQGDVLLRNEVSTREVGIKQQPRIEHPNRARGEEILSLRDAKSAPHAATPNLRLTPRRRRSLVVTIMRKWG